MALIGALVVGACGGEPSAPTKVELAVEIDGAGSGGVVSDPAGVNLASGDAPVSVEFDEGTEVTLTATPAAGSVFVGWGGACSGTGTCQLTLDADAEVTATFGLEAVEPETYALQVTIDGAGTGGVVSSPVGVDLASGDAPVSVEFDEGTEVTLTATAAAGSLFAGWGGACSGTGTCQLTLDADAAVTATFDVETIPQVTLTVAITGNGTGSVVSGDGAIDLASGDLAASALYDVGTSVTLTADADIGSLFGSWTNVAACAGTDDTCTIVLDDDVSLGADFFDPDADGITKDFQILASTDDAEEYQAFVNDAYPAGSVDTGSGDLDLTFDASSGGRGDVVTGLRYAGMDVPRNAVILDARITFTRNGAVSVGPGTVTLRFQGQAADDASTFVYGGAAAPANFNITGRPTTTNEVVWNVTTLWNTLLNPTPSLAPIVQEIVARDGWSSGNAMAFIISSPDSDADNRREARSYDFNPSDLGADAPVLSVTYYVPGSP